MYNSIYSSIFPFFCILAKVILQKNLFHLLHFLLKILSLFPWAQDTVQILLLSTLFPFTWCRSPQLPILNHSQCLLGAQRSVLKQALVDAFSLLPAKKITFRGIKKNSITHLANSSMLSNELYLHICTYTHMQINTHIYHSLHFI